MLTQSVFFWFHEVNNYANIHAYMWNVISDHFHEDIDTLSNKYHLQYVNDRSPTCRYLF
jgi:hypothetical protein